MPRACWHIAYGLCRRPVPNNQLKWLKLLRTLWLVAASANCSVPLPSPHSMPSAGRIHVNRFPPHQRFETWLCLHTEIRISAGRWRVGVGTTSQIRQPAPAEVLNDQLSHALSRRDDVQQSVGQRKPPMVAFENTRSRTASETPATQVARIAGAGEPRFALRFTVRPTRPRGRSGLGRSPGTS